MYKPVHVIEARVWGHTVGAVALDPRLGYYAFEYAPSFVRMGIELAPLTMPLAQAGEPFVFTELPELTYKRLPAMLADSLPDDFGNTLIDGWMAARGVERFLPGRPLQHQSLGGRRRVNFHREVDGALQPIDPGGRHELVPCRQRHALGEEGHLG